MLKSSILKRFAKRLPVLVLVIFCLSNLHAQEKPSHDPLEYEVSVTAQLLPVFAVDAQDNPVYDLKREELELYVGGKRCKILFFNGYELAMQERVEGEAAVKKAPAKKRRHPQRLNFIIIDSMISNVNTLGVSRVIAMQIIRQALPGDAFVIMESNQLEGFQYVIGPEKDKAKLAKALKGIKRVRVRREFNNASLRRLARSGQGQGSGEEAAQLNAMAAADEARERAKYQKDITRFSAALDRLKYALKSTTLPKTVYLISPGVMSWGLGNMPVTSLRFLEDAAKSVNYGGSLFYLINPIPRQKKGRDWGKSLKFMADAAGGKFISGSSIKDIAAKVKKSTSAYYELAFTTKSRPGQRSRIQVICKREGVRLTTIANSEQARPYRLMKGMEQKLFVLNIVNGGSWSRRMMRSVKKIEYGLLNAKRVKGKNGGSHILKDILVTIPGDMRQKNLHLFQLQVDAVTQKADLTMIRKKAKGEEQFQFKCLEGKSYYFVLIDPVKPSCIYSPVI
jgi:VWFA-related protein